MSMTELGQAIEATPQVLNFFKAYWTTFQERQKRERLRAVLHELNDLQLKDIGIARGEIERVASNRVVDPRGVLREGTLRGGCVPPRAGADARNASRRAFSPVLAE
ncbi:uncharacterized protein YjiS (DUF1127 family) [Bradyrhizobium sp. GM24.11]